MRFEGRDLKDYAEPIEVEDLRVGHVYFSVQFLDEDMVVPVLEPFVFLGTRESKYYFVDYDAYSQGIRDSAVASSEPEYFQVADKTNLKHMFEYERALDVLMACALRQRHQT